MQMVTRRIVLGGLAALPIGRAASAGAPEDIGVAAEDGRIAVDRYRIAGWAKRVSSVVSAVLARPQSSGRIGLLGFSLGGFVAAAAAAQEARALRHWACSMVACRTR